MPYPLHNPLSKMEQFEQRKGQDGTRGKTLQEQGKGKIFSYIRDNILFLVLFYEFLPILCGLSFFDLLEKI